MPANTRRPSAIMLRAKLRASASLRKVLVSRGLRFLGKVPTLRTSKVTYHRGGDLTSSDPERYDAEAKISQRSGHQASALKVEVSKLHPVQQNDLALGAADESENAELMQPR